MDVVNIHETWYRSEADKKRDKWRVTVPMFEADKDYPSDTLTFPVRCDLWDQIAPPLYEKRRAMAEERRRKHPKRKMIDVDKLRQELKCVDDKSKC